MEKFTPSCHFTEFLKYSEKTVHQKAAKVQDAVLVPVPVQTPA